MKKLLILTFFAILTSFLMILTYGIFESIVLNGYSIPLAAWKIEINNSVVTNEEKTFSIDDIIWNKSDNVVSGKVAPGIEGYFDIVIDPKDTGVSIRYDLYYDVEHLKSINSAFTITKIEALSDNKLILIDKYAYTGLIALDNLKTHVIRTYVKWEDIEENGHNDYITGTTNNSFELPVNIIVSQYLGEEIIEYNEE